MTDTQPKGPYRLVTVNTAPERAKRLIGRMVEALKDRYTIIHVDNCETIEEVEPKVTEHQPDVLFCASMWTAEQSTAIFETARKLRPDIKTHAIPHGLQVERGPDAIVEYLVENVPKLLDAEHNNNMVLRPTRLQAVAGLYTAHSKRFFSSSTPLKVELAYQLIEPSTQDKKRNGQPIVFMHGFMGNKLNNRSISKYDLYFSRFVPETREWVLTDLVDRALARDLNRDIYIVDLRNHGDSPHTPEHTYTHLAEDVSDFIKQHHLGKTALIGHSMGAKAAMVLALQSPETVTALIPVDNAPVSAMLGSPFNDYVKGMKEISEAHVTKQSEADKILAKYEPSLAIRQFLLTNLIRDPENDNKTLKFRVPLDTLGSNLGEMADFPWKFDRENAANNTDLPTYTGPTLIIRGLQSKYVSEKRLPAVKHFFPNAEIAGIDAGHWVISEKPEEFRQAVIKFFRENDIE
ncbi:hypothetical protein DPV78_004190 [Talaromyces pinophilus]|nr:hypothetical protein DPV78_004190 [Talaromyces pinophilus]